MIYRCTDAEVRFDLENKNLNGAFFTGPVFEYDNTKNIIIVHSYKNVELEVTEFSADSVTARGEDGSFELKKLADGAFILVKIFINAIPAQTILPPLYYKALLSNTELENIELRAGWNDAVSEHLDWLGFVENIIKNEKKYSIIVYGTLVDAIIERGAKKLKFRYIIRSSKDKWGKIVYSGEWMPATAEGEIEGFHVIVTVPADYQKVLRFFEVFS